MMGECRRPVSWSQWLPVSSPEPLKEKTPAWQAEENQVRRGRMVVTPVFWREEVSRDGERGRNGGSYDGVGEGLA
jgi:hypothetical protein